MNKANLRSGHCVPSCKKRGGKLNGQYDRNGNQPKHGN